MLDLAAVRAERQRGLALLADDFADFRRFCGLLKIQPAKGGGRIPFHLTWLQREYCRNRTPRDIILKPRQVYVTTLECARDLWIFLTRPGARVVVVCQSQTEHGAFKDVAYKFRLFIDSLRALGVALKFGTESAGEWTLPSRDSTLRIIEAGASDAAAAKKGRGGTVNRLHVTEAAFFEHAAVTFNALLESVPGPEHGSEIVIESTPNGAGGFYYDQWQEAVAGRSGFTPHFFRWWDHPAYRVALGPGETIAPQSEREQWLVETGGVRPDQLKWYRQKVALKGQALTDQEYPSDPETCFLVTGRTFFDPTVTASLLLKAKAPVETRDRGQLRIWEQPQRGETYVIGADPAEGDGPDFCAAIVYKRSNGAHVATLHDKFVPWDFARSIAQLGHLYNRALLVVERQNHGHAVNQALEREQRYPNRYWHAEDGKPGWPTTAVTRPMMLDTLEDTHRRGVWTSPDDRLLGEMRTFVVKDNGKAEAENGKHDDLVMAAAIGWAVVTRPSLARGVGAKPIMPF